MHGIARFVCSMCDFRSCLSSRLITHMKTYHRVVDTELRPLVPTRTNIDDDFFLVIPSVCTLLVLLLLFNFIFTYEFSLTAMREFSEVIIKFSFKLAYIL